MWCPRCQANREPRVHTSHKGIDQVVIEKSCSTCGMTLSRKIGEGGIDDDKRRED